MVSKFKVLFFAFVLVGAMGIGMSGKATGGKGNNSNISLYTGNSIPVDVLHYVLGESASFFGYTPDQMIRIYYQCECITVTQVGHNRYRVEMGGLGIEILVDMSSIFPHHFLEQEKTQK